MDSAREIGSCDGRGYHDLNDRVNISQQPSPLGDHMLEENVPFRDQPGLTAFQDDSGSETTGSSLKGLENDNDAYPWRPGGFRRFPYLGYICLFTSVICKYSLNLTPFFNSMCDVFDAAALLTSTWYSRHRSRHPCYSLQRWRSGQRMVRVATTRCYFGFNLYLSEFSIEYCLCQRLGLFLLDTSNQRQGTTVRYSPLLGRVYDCCGRLQIPVLQESCSHQYKYVFIPYFSSETDFRFFFCL